jgi:hypothetical protein
MAWDRFSSYGYEDGGTVEVGLIGPEGIIGIFHLLGPAKYPLAVFLN